MLPSLVRSVLLWVVAGLALPAVMTGPADAGEAGLSVRNVILVTMDGLRWQELFGGLDEIMMGDADNGTKNPDELLRRFAADTPEQRRERLMPFFWTVIARQGVVFGDPERDSHIRVSNGLNFSYPGYSEILCGFADPRIDSNAKTNNPNVTVLEWLNARPEFAGQVAAWCSWDVFPYIINTQRSGIPVNAGWMPLAEHLKPTPQIRQLDDTASELPRYWAGVRYDVFTAAGALECLKTQRPRVLYVGLGETDDWAHSARYDLYLDAAWRNDASIRELWETAQSLPEYRNQTALVVTTDHGRGEDRIAWRSHGRDHETSDRIWAAVMSPTVAASTPVSGQFTQSQIAATVAFLLGLDYPAAVPQAAAPLPLQKAR